MRKYLNHTRKLAEATPAGRNRIVDFWRVFAILVVIFGHWLAASIWLDPDGEIHLMNSLEWVPGADRMTWLVQVMPIFFLAGGYANARALSKVESGRESRHVWITSRLRRLFTPVLPLLAFWAGLIIALRGVIPHNIIRAGAMSATVALWFLAVYLLLIAIAPFTHDWWRRQHGISIAVLLGLTIAVDVARLVFDVPGIGWLNFLFAWAGIHQAGYLWSDLDREEIPGRYGWVVGAASLSLLILLTSAGIYPVAMLGIPGSDLTNVTPPTLGIVLLGGIQLGVIWGTQRAIRRFTSTVKGWHIVVSVSGVMMTLYLWHLTAMSLIAAIGLNVSKGLVFTVQPGRQTWWLTRPVWLLVLAATTLALTAVMARFEWRINNAPAPSTPAVAVGVLLAVGAMAAVATQGLSTSDGDVRWLIPLAAAGSAIALGSLPSRGKHSVR